MIYYVYYGISLFCLSQSGVIIRWSEENPLILGAWRLLMGGLILMAGDLFLNSKNKSPISIKELKYILLAGFAFFLHLYSYAYSAHHTSISHLMLIFSINPLTTAIGSWIIFKEKLTTRKFLAYLLALLGIYILAREESGNSDIFGDLMAVVAAITFTIYALFSQKARQSLPNTIFISRMYLVGSIFFFLAIFLYGLSPIPNSEQSWNGIFALTVFPTLIGHGIFIYSLKHIPLYVLSLGKLIEPAMAAITAYFTFGEYLSGASFLSFAIIVISVAMVVITPTKY